jgi:hypothetical protein
VCESVCYGAVVVGAAVVGAVRVDTAGGIGEFTERKRETFEWGGSLSFDDCSTVQSVSVLVVLTNSIFGCVMCSCCML